MDILRESLNATQTDDRSFNGRYSRTLNDAFVSDDLVPDTPPIHGDVARTLGDNHHPYTARVQRADQSSPGASFSREPFGPWPQPSIRLGNPVPAPRRTR